MPRKILGIGFGTVDPTFPSLLPTEFSLTRPLLVNNPGALLVGRDWQGYDQALLQSEDDGGRIGFDGPDAHSIQINNPLYSSVGTGAGVFRAEIAADATLDKHLRCWQTDGGSNQEHWDVRNGYSFSARDQIWIRFTKRLMPGWTNLGPNLGGCGPIGSPSVCNSWKIMFGTVRHFVHNNSGYTDNDPLQKAVGTPFTGDTWDGSADGYLPGSPTPSGNWCLIEDEVDDGELYEFIACEERNILVANDWRVRRWIRRLTLNNVIDPGPRDRKVGWYMLNTNVTMPSALNLGINQNAARPIGDLQWHAWGPWEVIDAAILPDPYGLATDML